MSSTWCYDSGEVSVLHNAEARHNKGMNPAPPHGASHQCCVGARVMPDVMPTCDTGAEWT